jgi:hypothetical protein
MTNFKSWELVSGPDSGELVLVLDVPAARRAYFAALTASIAPYYTLLRAKLPPYGWGSGAVDFWLGDILPGNCEVRAVLGYRVGGVYAAAIAERISKTSAAPDLIVIEPQFASVALLVDEFRREIAAISSLLADDELVRAGRVADSIARIRPSDIARAGAEICQRYRELSVVAFERVGLGDVSGNTSITALESTILCLCETTGFDPRQAWANAATIVPRADIEGPDGKLLDFRQMLPLDAR